MEGEKGPPQIEPVTVEGGSAISLVKPVIEAVGTMTGVGPAIEAAREARERGDGKAWRTFLTEALLRQVVPLARGLKDFDQTTRPPEWKNSPLVESWAQAGQTMAASFDLAMRTVYGTLFTLSQLYPDLNLLDKRTLMGCLAIEIGHRAVAGVLSGLGKGSANEKP